MFSRKFSRILGLATAAVAVAATLVTGLVAPHLARAQLAGMSASDLRTLALKSTNSLKTVRVADAPTFKQFVVNRTALQQLGKALFWDQQVGSDGQACASCHFHAGADNRSKNQVNPGFRNTLVPGGDNLFGTSALRQLKPNLQLTLADFPFHGQNNDTNDIVSSQGVFNAGFSATLTPGETFWPSDLGIPAASVFVDRDIASWPMVRNVEPRNTPTSINAVFNHRNFWDGRGRNEFNGVNPLGSLEKGFIVKVVPSKVVLVQTRISNSSAASQAVGPPLSGLEMSFGGRSFADVGRKILKAKPLARQTIDPADSVLGGVVLTTYEKLVQDAFDPTWWNNSDWRVDISTGSPVLVQSSSPSAGKLFTVMEYNFSLYVGMAIQEYEKLLIADDSPFDRFMDGDLGALNDSQQRGLQVFLGQGKCIACHGGAELTNASLSNVRGFQVLERMIMGNDRVAVYDNGFYNTGVRPTLEDLGVGGTEGLKSRPLSNSRAYQNCVNDSLGGNTNSTQAQVQQANQSCGVPRILARPIEAARLLAKAAVGNGNALALVSKANALLTGIPPDLVQGSCALAKNAFLACPTTTTTVTNPDLTVTTTTVQNNGALDVLRLSGSADTDLLAAAVNLLPDQASPGTSPNLLAPVLAPKERVAVDGAFKTSTVRNIELTAPYFHNGGTATLEQLVDFYDRGGDFAEVNKANLDTDIQPLLLSAQQKNDLVNFMKATTDDRVRNETGYFDHPNLTVPNGGTYIAVTPNNFIGGTQATFMEDLVVIPAVGKTGGCRSAVPAASACANGLGTNRTPFANFLQLLTPP